MSVHSVDHMGPPGNDDGYRGYDIDENGQVVEFYDHTNESSVHLGPGSGISGSRRLLADPTPAPAPSVSATSAARRRRVRKSAGCCSSCVGCMITIGRLPIASAICLLLIWIGCGMFFGCGWAVMHETQAVFSRYGPEKYNGNPALDPAPEYVPIGGGSSNIDHHYVLRDPNNPGNRVPEVLLGIQYSFYGLIPFMFFFSLAVIIDGANSTREIHSRHKGCKSSSAGVCCSVFLIFLSYVLLLAWVFWLAFTTLGVYYYRIVMLRCDDLNSRETMDEKRRICIDLVQLGLIMYRRAQDEYFGKICGPGTTSASVGQLEEYCDNYSHGYQLMLCTWAGALLVIIAMMHSLIISSGNYNILQKRYSRPKLRSDHTVASHSPTMTHRTTTTNTNPPAPLPYIVGNRDTSSNGDYRRRRSKDIELEYMDRDSDAPTSSVTYLPPKRFEKDSHVGVDYYYKRY